MILYTDPGDYAVEGRHDAVYPKTVYLPGTGVQRGSLEVNTGDPQTPGHPSIGRGGILESMSLIDISHIIAHRSFTDLQSLF